MRPPTIAMARRSLLTLPASIRARTFASASAASEVSPQASPPPWRPSNVLDDWVAREARPISLRQLTFFGRTLTESRLLSSANYVREELPTRIAHRLRNMQTLPYSALTNPHIRHVYELYYTAFERFRKVPAVRTLEDNDRFCAVINGTLREHLSVIPRLAMGILEIQDAVSGEQCDRFMTTLLRSRISRRVIAQQHLALTETFHEPWHFPNATPHPLAPSPGSEDDFIGEIFLKCNAREIIEKCAAGARELVRRTHGSTAIPDTALPEIRVRGHLDTTFPYIPSHLEYIIGELLRNSVQATVEQQLKKPASERRHPAPPIEVLICEAAQHVIIRVSDHGGGVDPDVLPHLWSFAKGPRRSSRLRNLEKVPKLAAMREDVRAPAQAGPSSRKGSKSAVAEAAPEGFSSSLTSLAGRPPELKLGIGLPISKLYAEYWAGSLEIHSLEGYGCDAFLQISRLGNKNEVLSTRASMDAV